MKTTSEKLIAEAEKLEAQAQALRIAAGVMNGHEHVRKQAGAEATVQQAVKLRKAQRSTNGAAPEPPEGVDINSLTDVAYAYRQALVRYILQDGARRAREVGDYLKERGVGGTDSTKTAARLMRAMPDVRCKGHAQAARWMLRKPREASAS